MPVTVGIRKAPAALPEETPTRAPSTVFFLAGAWVRGGYLYTPPVAGKQHWFKLGPELIVEPTVRNGINGYRLLCEPALFRRRGLTPEAFLDPEQSLFEEP